MCCQLHGSDIDCKGLLRAIKDPVPQTSCQSLCCATTQLSSDMSSHTLSYGSAILTLTIGLLGSSAASFTVL